MDSIRLFEHSGQANHMNARTLAGIAVVFSALVPLARVAPAAQDRGADQKPQAGSAKDEDERVYELGAGIQPPRITRRVNPNYSNVRGVSVKGSVAVSVVISSRGVPRDVLVVKGLEPEVDRCAVEAIKQWQFAPAQKDGKPVAVKATIEVQFHAL